MTYQNSTPTAIQPDSYTLWKSGLGVVRKTDSLYQKLFNEDGEYLGPVGAVANTVSVAASGGQFTTIQAAIDSITDASATKPYSVLVYPGLYAENLVHKQYVSVTAMGASDTIIYGRHTLSAGTNLLFNLTLAYDQVDAEPMFKSVAGSTSLTFDLLYLQFSNTTSNPSKLVELTDCGFYPFRTSWSVSVANSLTTTQNLVYLDGTGECIGTANDIRVTAAITGAGCELNLVNDHTSGSFNFEPNAISISSSNAGTTHGFVFTGPSTTEVKAVQISTIKMVGSGVGEAEAISNETTPPSTVRSRYNLIEVTGFSTGQNYAFDVRSGNTVVSDYDTITADGYYVGSGTVTLNGLSCYGGVGVTGGGSFTVRRVNDWHGVNSLVDTNSKENATVIAGATGTVTAAASGGTGITTITSNAHGLSDGDIVTIVNSTSYTGVFTVANKTLNTFQIAATYVATESGPTWIRPSQVVPSVRGAFKFEYSLSTACAINNKDYEFQLYRNTTPLTYTKSLKSYSTGSAKDQVSGLGVGIFEKGDRYWFGLRGVTDTTAISLLEGVVLLEKKN
jgi:hypothetical protein